ncbi:MAG: TonB-dependent receptor [Bacteroidales bacterium]|nr:TonB-dependent receptor [Bacteroidales bacterium]
MIEASTPYIFFYNTADVDKSRKVTLEFTDADLTTVLGKLFEGQENSFKIDGRQVYITKKAAAGAAPQATRSNPTRLSGYVTDREGEPLPGAAIMVKGSKRGVMTDENGAFSIDGIKVGTVLVASSLGMEDLEFTFTGQDNLTIALKQQSNALDEVTVVAFGTQKKESVIGAITTIDPGKLKIPSSNLTTALAGNMAGIIAYQRTGEPGQDNADFFVRGITTFGANTHPLILIDNIELTTTDLARLQPDDIASFSIMKDATATALYGARGANGVILVTTKRGSESSAKVFARLESSISQPTQVVELADPVTYMVLNNEALLTRDPNADILYSQDKIENTGKPGANPYIYPANDWYDMLFAKQAFSQRANVSVSGGGKVAQYYVSGAATKDNGILKVDKRNSFNNNIDFRNYTIRANVDINVTSTTKLGVRMTGNFDDYTGPINSGDEMYSMVVHSNPVLFPAYYEPDADHQFTKHILFGNYDTGQYTNPYAQMVRGYKDRNRSQMLSVIDASQDLSFITPGLSLSAMFNISRLAEFSIYRSYNPFYYTMSQYDSFTGDYVLKELNPDGGTEYLGYSESGKTVQSTLYTESRLNYNREFGKHGVSGLLVFTTRELLNANAGSLQLSLPSRNAGLAGRFTYSYASKYFAEFNFGYNGSERFSKNHRWGFFPSAGVAWLVSNEEFWKPIKPVVSNLKLRYSYGLVGNDQIGSASDRFFYLSNVNMNSGGAQFGEYSNTGGSGISVTRYANDNITWETSYKHNYAAEIGLFDKLNIIAEYFTEHRTNILMNRAYIPSTMGLTAAVRANVGEARAHGVDIQADYQQVWSKDFWTSARANFTWAKSRFEVYEEPNYKEYWRSRIGYSLAQNWGYIAERLFVDDAEAKNSPAQNFGSEYGGGDIKYTDVNRDGIIDAKDMVPIGNPTSPEIIYGFGFSAGWKGFDASVFFQGLANESFWINASATSPFQGQTQLLKVYADSHWSENNQDLYALWPRLSGSINNNNVQSSTWFMRDGSFLRLKQVEFGYTLPRKLTDKAHIDNLRLYVSGSNLWTWSRFRLWDVEMAGNGLGYPIQRIVNLGLNITFK